MARRLRYRRRSTRASGGGAAWAAVFMIVVFAVVALMRQAQIGGIGVAAKSPLPTSTIETVSNTVRLGAQDYYAIQFGVYENSQAAQEKAQEYVERGAAGYIWQDGAKYRVLAAVYTSLDDAQTIKERLASQGIDTYIYTIHHNTLEMRVSASESQRALLSQAFAFIERAAREIGDISVSLDKQTMNAQEAEERMLLLRDEAQTYAQRAGTELGSDENGVIEGVKRLLGVISAQYENISAQNSREALAMTAKIKYNYLEVLWNVGNFIESVLALSAA